MRSKDLSIEEKARFDLNNYSTVRRTETERTLMGNTKFGQVSVGLCDESLLERENRVFNAALIDFRTDKKFLGI